MPTQGSGVSSATPATAKEQGSSPEGATAVTARGGVDSPTASVATVVGAASSGLMPADGLVVVSFLSGNAYVTPRDPFGRNRYLHEGDVVSQGDEISVSSTDGVERRQVRLPNGRLEAQVERYHHDGKLELQVNGNSFVRLDERTQFKILKLASDGAPGHRRTLFSAELSSGHVWVNDRRGRGANTALTIRAEPVEVTANGAQLQMEMTWVDTHPTIHVRSYAGSPTATLLDTPSVSQTLTPGMQWDVPRVGGWARPKAFDAEATDDGWVAWNKERDASE